MNIPIALSTLIAGAISVSVYAAETTCPWREHVTYCNPCGRETVEAYGELYCREEHAINQHPGFFSRKGPRLTIHAVSGVKRSFVDEPNPDSPLSRGTPGYTLVDVFPEAGYASINVSYYENSSYLFVNLRTGKSVDFRGVPVLSPDGRYVAVSNSDVVFNVEAKLAVYAVRPDRLVKEFDTDDAGFRHGLERVTKRLGSWGPHSIEWKSGTEFSFVAESLECQSSQCAPGKPPTTYSFSKRRIEGKDQWWLK